MSTICGYANIVRSKMRAYRTHAAVLDTIVSFLGRTRTGDTFDAVCSQNIHFTCWLPDNVQSVAEHNESNSHPQSGTTHTPIKCPAPDDPQIATVCRACVCVVTSRCAVLAKQTENTTIVGGHLQPLSNRVQRLSPGRYGRVGEWSGIIPGEEPAEQMKSKQIDCRASGQLNVHKPPGRVPTQRSAGRCSAAALRSISSGRE